MTDDHATPLDAAHAASAAAPENDALRLALHGRLLEAELHLLLEAETDDDRLAPRVFALESGPVVLAFDRDDRLAGFLDSTLGEPAPYAALTGRRLVTLLARKGLGLGVNLGVAPSEMLLPPEAIDWLAALAASRPERTEGAPRRFAPPPADPALESALAARLDGLDGLFEAAHLAAADLPDGPRLMLALTGVPETAEPAVAAAVAETLRFLDGAPPLDVTFLAPDAPALAAIAAVARVFHPPVAAAAPAPDPARVGPGRDPDRPPILR